MNDNVEEREITKELQESYLDYAMSVIVSRALPDVRDGLKPVHRRILWAMWDSGLTSLSKTRKSANVVGETMARYHPHGDIAIYDALARMAQEWSLRYPLVKGQGNFGSIDGDSPAAMRYCVTGNTLVVTTNGLTPIKDIGSSSEDIETEILSRDRNINRATKWFDSGEHQTIRITTHQGFSLEGTTNHPILVWSRNPVTGEPHFSWKLLGRLKEGDVAVIDRTSDLAWPKAHVQLEQYRPIINNRKVQKKVLPQQLNEDLAYVLGALIAEGTLYKKELEFCNSDREWINEFVIRWARVFLDCRLHRFERKPNSFGEKPYETIEIHSQYVVEFLRNIGLEPAKSAAKTVPRLIFSSPKRVVAAFLSSYFEGDGSISYSSKMTELSCISTSELLLKEVQILLLRFGIVGTRRFDQYRNTHKLYLRGLHNCILFRDQIGFLSNRKQIKLEQAIERIHKSYSQKDFVPYLSEFSRSTIISSATWEEKNFVIKHNFDRYATMESRYQSVVLATNEKVRPRLENIFEQLLKTHYLFDPIILIENSGQQSVYSIRVDSECHSFIANGFVNHNTEAKLSKISDELLLDIEKETVDWQPNYDATRDEPKVLPAKLPNLLLNGVQGIAVGMTTNIPPHNLREVSDAILFLGDNPDATNDDLAQFVKGPDFPTGGIIFDQKAIKAAYASGKGAITIRAKAEIEERKNRQFDVVVTEIPYQVNKSELIKKIAELAQEKKIEGIRDLRDESDREGLRIVVELKNDVPPQKILNQLYEHTDLQKDFHLNVIALVDDGIQPRLLSLKDILVAYLTHRKEIIKRRTQFDLKKAEERAHILEGLAKALGVIDKVISTIKKSKDKEDAHVNLVKIFKLSDIQATAILEMRLQTLAALEREKIENELKEKLALIKELGLILKSPAKILKIIKDEVSELKEKYGDERRTKVVPTPLKAFNEEDLIPEEEAIVTFSAGGYIKRLPPDTFRSQRRGGKGLIGSEVAEEDFLSHFFNAKTHDSLLFFTDKGRVFQTKVYEIPQASRISKGKAIHNFLELPTDENVTALVSYRATSNKRQVTSKNDSLSHVTGHMSQYLVIVTKKGLIKKTSIADFENIRRTGIIAISLKKGDALRWVKLSGGDDQVMLTTKLGQSIRFKESQIRSMGRTASGVRAIRLKKDDEVAGFDIIKASDKKQGTSDKGQAGDKLLVVMANGFAKQTNLKEYKVQSRGGSGIRTANVTQKTGQLISAHIVGEEKEIFALSQKGQMIRTDLLSVRATGRSAQGVKIINLKAGDKLAGTVII